MSDTQATPHAKHLAPQADPPNWWHPRGSNMHVTDLDTYHSKLLIMSNAAELTIAPMRYTPDWVITWKVRHSEQDGIGVIGRPMPFRSEDLQIAFGLPSRGQKKIKGTWMIERFGCDAARQGLYIRSGRYLNIPGPGTGHNGDPNISIEVTEKIKQAVRKLLEARGKQHASQRNG